MNRKKTALAAAICTALAGTAHAAVFNVTNTDDAGPGSLRQALIDANANAEADTIDLSTVSGQTISLTSGQLDCYYDDVTIDGAGVTIDAGGNSRVLAAYYCDLTINDATITGGSVGAPPPRGLGPTAGGGIYAKYGDLTLNNAVVTGNSAEVGGGVAAIGYSGNLAVTDSQITGNTAFLVGGGLVAYSYSGSASITGSTISGNTSTGAAPPRTPEEWGLPENARMLQQLAERLQGGNGDIGGAILASGYGDLTLQQSTVTGNTANTSVGGVALTGKYGSVLVDQSTIDSNQAGGYFGGISVQGSLDTLVRNTTISGNSASSGGAGGTFFSTYSGNNRGTINPRFEFSTITGNSASTSAGGLYADTDMYYPAALDLNGVVIAGNTAPVDPDLGMNPDAVVNLNYSLLGVDPSSGTVNKDATSAALTGAAPMLGPLADNGGPTRTHLPQAGSPVIDAVPAAQIGCGGPIVNDQRGQPRPVDGGCDIGSVEGQGGPGIPEIFPVPVLNRWGLLLMGGLLGLAGWLGLRRKPDEAG